MRGRLIASLTLAGILATGGAAVDASTESDAASADAIAFGGPSSIIGQFEADQASKASFFDVDRAVRPFRDLTERLKSDDGLTLGLDYNALFQYASESLDRQHAAGGVLRVYGTAQVFDQVSGHPGAIELKVENRHLTRPRTTSTPLRPMLGFKSCRDWQSRPTFS